MSQSGIAKTLTDHVEQAMGREPADLVIKNVRILNVVTGTIGTGDIAICGRTIIGVYDAYNGKTEIDGTGLTAVPGFIDTHLHIESSLVTPYEFDRLALTRGTTTACPDPHEMANVLGTHAFDYFLESARGTLMDLRVGASSCVPATPIGTSGAVIDAAAIAPYAGRVSHLAEVMNLPAVWNADADMMAKLAFFTGGHVDGHFPGVGLSPAHGVLVNAAAAVNIKTDHECTTLEEALFKRERGIRILIREGTGCKNLAALMPLIDRQNSFTTAFCTDDFHPADIVRDGHLDFVIRKAIDLYDPAVNGPTREEHIVSVYRMASFAAAHIMGLTAGLERRGEIAPGALADIVLVRDLARCDVRTVIKAGRVVDEALFAARPPVAPVGAHSVRLRAVTPADFRLEAESHAVTVVGLIPDNVLTRAIETELVRLDGALQPDPERDILKCAVIERHGRSDGNIGIGFVNGFAFQKGAIAATVGHDDHNITVAGTNDDDMAVAVNALRAMQGGYVVVEDGRVTASLPLPIAGLMSDAPFEVVAAQEVEIRKAAAALTGGPEGEAERGLPQPLISLAFISLSVIPDARICDAGLTRNDGTGPRLVWDQRRPKTESA